MKKMYARYLFVVTIMWTGVGLAMVVFYMFLMLPQQRQIVDIENRIAAQIQKQQKLKEASSPENQTHLKNQLTDRRQKLSNFVADFQHSDSLTFAVSEIARELNIDSFASRHVPAVQDKQLEKCTHIGEQRINITYNADFQRFAKMLNTLERNRPVVFVDKFKVERAENGTEEIKTEMELAVFLNRSAN